MASLIERISEPEIFIGLVAPIGADNEDVINSISKYFQNENYDVVKIKVTETFDIMAQMFPPTKALDSKFPFDRYNAKIEYGNQLREITQDNSILAALAIQQITGARFKNRMTSRKLNKRVFIIDQFKRPEEIALLRAVYGELFFQISTYSKRSARVESLTEKFKLGQKDSQKRGMRSRAEELVERDENERNQRFGQRVGKVFHDADFIVNADVNHKEVCKQIYRFCEALFSSNAITPSKIEYGMFAAQAAALRTADLSRQVGAAIFTKGGEVVATGSNEVPKAGGGTYWSDDKFDDRDYVRRIDPNQSRKEELVDEIITALKVKKSKVKAARKSISDTAFLDALEYGRITHAEMCAIIDAARRGAPLKNTTLFSTTFPCHLCAKHIVAAGIDEVYFLEPYPKSLASKLHSDSLSIESVERGRFEKFPATKFIHFFGITPRRYREFFQRSRRKDASGEFQEYSDGQKKPFIDSIYAAHGRVEKRVLKSLVKALKKAVKSSN